MLSAAGISELGSKLESMAWGLAGGRLHDIAGGVSGIVHSTRTDVDRWTYLNSYAIDNGPRAFADRYNEGRLPQVVITDPIGVPLPVPDGQSLAMVLVPLSIAVMLVGLRYRDSRWVAVSGLLVVFGTAIGMGWIRADNFRFLMVSSAFGIASATSLMPLLVGRWANRKAGVPVVMMGAP
jgi:hypothetical protein